MSYEIVRLTDRPELAERMADWFSGKWSVPRQAYAASMDECLSGKDVPQWYTAMDGDTIIGGLGVIENDFHNRIDLTPNVCAVFVEPPYRRQGVAGALLHFVCGEMAQKGVDTLFLITDHTGFYERYGWEFLCMVQPDGEEALTRMYVHRAAQDECTLTWQIRKALFAAGEPAYASFQRRLIPNIPPESVIGVRTPQLRAMAKELAKAPEIGGFLRELPHRYFEENQLQAFILSGIKDYDRCIRELEAFLPFADNWATCDQMSPKCFKKNRPALLAQIKAWIASERPYTVRFGLGMLMEHFLDEDFEPEQLMLAASVRSDEYYVNMMTAWYFATALTKQYEAALPVIENGLLDTWTHNKTIRKAGESFLIPEDRKAYLKSLKR